MTERTTRERARQRTLCEIKQTPRQPGGKELESREKQTPISLTAHLFQAQGGRRTTLRGKDSKVRKKRARTGLTPRLFS